MTRGALQFLVACGLGFAAAGCSSPARSADGPKVAAPIVMDGGVRPPATPISSTIALPLAPPAVEHVPPASGEDRAARDQLAGAMHKALGGLLLPESLPMTRAAIGAAQAMAARQHLVLDRRQAVLVVDRSPAVQRLWIVAVIPGRPWEALGSVHVSTGKPGRKEHFRTPVGVFDNSSDILGYRAQGTYNENHIRGNGLKGARVWDFGWQTTDDWRTKNAPMAIRMEMHATDPANLEGRLGHWDSEGCIRIHARTNTFLDEQGLIDAKLREAAQTDRRFAALLPKTPASPMAGSVVVVVDTSDPAAPPSDRALANRLEHKEPPPDDAG